LALTLAALALARPLSGVRAAAPTLAPAAPTAAAPLGGLAPVGAIVRSRLAALVALRPAVGSARPFAAPVRGVAFGAAAAVVAVTPLAALSLGRSGRCTLRFLATALAARTLHRAERQALGGPRHVVGSQAVTS
jgi:hypothetical protein